MYSIHFSRLSTTTVGKCTCFFSTIGDDGSRQCPSYAASFVRVFWNSLPKTLCVEHFSHKSSINLLQYIFHVIKNLHKEMHMFFSTIGEVRSREVTSDAASFVRVFWKSVLFFVLKKCNGKYKGLAIQYIFHDCFENSREICIQYIFHDCLNLHREMHMFFFHYWRSQEPPMFLRIACFRSSFWKLDVVFVSCENLQR